MKPLNVFITACAFGFLGGIITGKSVFAEDCKYEQDINLTHDGSILSADTTYECKESKPIVVLDPTLETIVIEKQYRTPVVSTSDYRDMVLGNNNTKGLDFLFSVLYNGN